MRVAECLAYARLAASTDSPTCMSCPRQDPQLLLELYDAIGQQEAAAELHLQAALELAAGGGGGETAVQRELARAKEAYTRASDAHQASTQPPAPACPCDLHLEGKQVVVSARLGFCSTH